MLKEAGEIIRNLVVLPTALLGRVEITQTIARKVGLPEDDVLDWGAVAHNRAGLIRYFFTDDSYEARKHDLQADELRKRAAILRNETYIEPGY